MSEYGHPDAPTETAGWPKWITLHRKGGAEVFIQACHIRFVQEYADGAGAIIDQGTGPSTIHTEEPYLLVIDKITGFEP